MPSAPTRAKRKPADPPGPTERQSDETAAAFAAFRCYLEMGGGRSTAKVRQKIGKSKRLVDRWSSTHGWVARVREFENEIARVADDEHLDELAKRSRRQAQIAQLHGEATSVVANEILRRVRDEPDFIRKLDAAQLLQLEATLARAHNRAVLTERLALGMTTEQEGEPLPRSQAEAIVARLSDDELDQRLTGVDELAERRAKKAAS